MRSPVLFRITRQIVILSLFVNTSAVFCSFRPQTRGKPLQKAPAYELPPSRTSPNGVDDCSVLRALCATFRPPSPAP
jgi:hypothetical protein